MQLIKRHWEKLILAVILAIAGFLSFYGIWNEGYANEFYAACVKSMLTSWHNFFFASFDPGGFVTVDKPPVDFWIQALSAKIFGFHGFSIIFPQALAAVVSVAVLYHLVKRNFGIKAGLVSALALAVSPIFIAVSKTNNIDSMLVLTVLLAAWALMAAAEKGSLKYLLLAMALVGVGFNEKMMEAYLVLPVFYLVYFFSAKIKYKKRILHLALATVLLLAVSFSWSLAVDLTPAGQRPYVDNSGTNSEIALALGYNGLQRITGDMTSFGANNAPGATARTPSQGSRGFNRGGGIGMNEGGERGVLRMFNQQMAGQDSWLLPLALFGILILLLKLRKPPRGDQSVRETSLRNLLLWGGWVLVMAAYFSVAGFFHRYYISMLAPGVAALAGIGLLEMCRVYRGKGWKSCLLPASIIVTAVVQCVVLSRYNSWARVLVPIIYLLAGGSSAALILLKAFQKNNLRAAMAACVVAGVAALLISPAIWSYTPILYGSQTSTPYAGPELGGSSYGGGMGNNIGGFADRAGQDAANQKLIDFLLKNNSGEKFIVAVPNASSAEPIILQTGKAVMSVGGFMGNDNILTVGSLAGIVKKGELRYYLIQGMGMGGQSAIIQWVIAHGKAVPYDEWSEAGGGGYGGAQGGTLYDLAPGRN